MHGVDIYSPRPLLLAQADQFAALVRSVFTGLAVEPPPSAARLSGDDVRAHLAEGGGGTTLADVQAGLLWAEKDGGLYVSRIAVNPALRRRGAASRLLGAAEAEARRRGLPKLWLATRLALTGNRRLFARCGFGEAASHAYPGYAVPTFIDMERWLTSEPITSPNVGTME